MIASDVIGRVLKPARRYFIPSVAWLGYLFLLLPSLIIIPISFSGDTELTFPPKAISVALFAQFFNDPAWWGAAVQSAAVATATTIISLVLGVPAGYALARGTFPGRTVLEILFLAPMLVPVIVLGLGLYIHMAILNLTDTFIGIVAAHVVLVTPFTLVAVMAGLRQASPTLEMAALIMGASQLRIFFGVVIPQIFPSIVVAALFAFLISFDEVIVAYFITGPASGTLPVKMYSAIRWEISPVLAAVSTLLTVVSLAVCLSLMALQPPVNTNDRTK